MAQEYIVTVSGDEVEEQFEEAPTLTIVINHYWKDKNVQNVEDVRNAPSDLNESA